MHECLEGESQDIIRECQLELIWLVDNSMLDLWKIAAYEQFKREIISNCDKEDDRLKEIHQLIDIKGSKTLPVLIA